MNIYISIFINNHYKLCIKVNVKSKQFAKDLNVLNKATKNNVKMMILY